MRRLVVVVMAALVIGCVGVGGASAAPGPGRVSTMTPGSRLIEPGSAASYLSSPCPDLGGCNPISIGINAAGNAANSAASAVGNAAMGGVAGWFIDSARTVGGWVTAAMKSTSTPGLSSAWFRSVYGYMLALGMAMAGLAAMIGLCCALLKRSPGAVGDVLYGIYRAGLLAGLVLPLTAIALSIADGISADVMAHMPASLVTTLQSGWGSSSLGSFGSSFVAALVAFIEILVGLLVWVELLFRAAAIVLAVAFIVVTLGLAVWPRLLPAHHRLVEFLVVFVAMKPVILVVMWIGGQAIAGGLSAQSGVGPSVGAVVDGLVILAMAAFAPWTLLRFAGLGGGSMSRGRGSSSSSRESFSSMSATSTMPAAALAGAGAGPMLASSYIGGTASGTGPGGRGLAGGGATGSPGRGSPPAGASPMAGGAAAAMSGVGSGGSAGRTWPPTIAAAAGWVGVASIARAVGQNVAEHGVARVHAATGGHGIAPGHSPLGEFRGARAGTAAPSPATLPYGLGNVPQVGHTARKWGDEGPPGPPPGGSGGAVPIPRPPTIGGAPGAVTPELDLVPVTPAVARNPTRGEAQ